MISDIKDIDLQRFQSPAETGARDKALIVGDQRLSKITGAIRIVAGAFDNRVIDRIHPFTQFVDLLIHSLGCVVVRDDIRIAL